MNHARRSLSRVASLLPRSWERTGVLLRVPAAVLARTASGSHAGGFDRLTAGRTWNVLGFDVELQLNQWVHMSARFDEDKTYSIDVNGKRYHRTNFTEPAVTLSDEETETPDGDVYVRAESEAIAHITQPASQEDYESGSPSHLRGLLDAERRKRVQAERELAEANASIDDANARLGAEAERRLVIEAELAQYFESLSAEVGDGDFGTEEKMPYPKPTKLPVECVTCGGNATISKKYESILRTACELVGVVPSKADEELGPMIQEIIHERERALHKAKLASADNAVLVNYLESQRDNIICCHLLKDYKRTSVDLLAELERLKNKCGETEEIYPLKPRPTNPKIQQNPVQPIVEEPNE